MIFGVSVIQWQRSFFIKNFHDSYPPVRFTDSHSGTEAPGEAFQSSNQKCIESTGIPGSGPA
jgi:hypothetical protein